MKLGILGASGRMGQAVMALARQSDIAVTAAIVSQQSNRYGELVRANDAGAGLQYQHASDLKSNQVEILIDFSLPQALPDNLALAKKLNVPIVVCTTGLSQQHHHDLNHAAQSIPVLYAANTSVGITLLRQLVELTAAALPDTDIEIFEAHHNKKRDAPSGTAVVLGESAARGRGQTLKDVSAGVRGDGVRKSGTIGFSVMRAADIIGEHTVLFAHEGERLELTHRVSNRQIFARGAIQAAQWLKEQPSGYYEMADVLALNTLLKQFI